MYIYIFLFFIKLMYMDVYAWGYKQVITSVRATHFFSYRYIDKFYLFF